MINFYWEYEQFDDVIKVFKGLEDKHQPNSHLNNIIGESYRNLGDLNHASNHLSKAITQDSTNWSAYLNLGEVYMNKLNWIEARHMLFQSVKINPNYSGTFNEIGICEFELGNIKKAIDFTEQALSLIHI